MRGGKQQRRVRARPPVQAKAAQWPKRQRRLRSCVFEHGRPGSDGEAAPWRAHGGARGRRKRTRILCLCAPPPGCPSCGDFAPQMLTHAQMEPMHGYGALPRGAAPVICARWGATAARARVLQVGARVACLLLCRAPRATAQPTPPAHAPHLEPFLPARAPPGRRAARRRGEQGSLQRRSPPQGGRWGGCTSSGRCHAHNLARTRPTAQPAGAAG